MDQIPTWAKDFAEAVAACCNEIEGSMAGLSSAVAALTASTRFIRSEPVSPPQKPM